MIQVDRAIDHHDVAEGIPPLAQEQGMALMISLPFGRGAASWAQIFLKYIVSHPARPIAIPGTAQARYVEDNMGAARGPLPDSAMRRRMEQFIDAL